MRIGVLGGTFDPIHNGHISMAKHILHEFKLDKVLIMVASVPPHKDRPVTRGELRFEMASTACSAYGECIEPCGLELKRYGKSYTSDTLRELRAMYPADDIYYIVGSDMLENIPSWHEPDVILKLCTIICVRRGRKFDDELSAQTLRREYDARVCFSGMERVDISSTMIRERVFNAEPVRALVPRGIESIIYENALYMPESIKIMCDKLKASLSPKRFRHSAGASLEAVELAAKYGVDAKLARVAGLLHDCARYDIAKQLETAERAGIDATTALEKPEGLLHSAIGAFVAKTEYGIDDARILDAISAHTAGCINMTPLQKIIYLADKLEPSRDYEGVDFLRSKAAEGLDAGVVAAMSHCIDYITKSGRPLDKSILHAREYIIQKANGGNALDAKTKEQVLGICKVLYNKKAEDISAIYVADKTIIAEWFVICSGRSVPQVKALCEELDEKYPEMGLDLRRKEGYAEGRWIVMDFGNILVHIFHPDERKYYNMERLWIDSPESIIDYSRIADAEEDKNQ